MPVMPSDVQAVLSTSGQPLDARARAYFEARFHHDFSGVKVHTDAVADRSTREMGASAYAVGSHLVFGTGQYAVQTRRGRALLAHELAHTIQQGSAPVSGLLLRLGLPKSSAAQESEAEQAGAAVLSRRRPVLTTGSPPVIACATDDDKKLHSDEDLGDVIAKFNKHNDSLGADVLRRIRNGIVHATSSSKTFEVAYAFFDYYSGWFGNSIAMMSPDEVAKASKGELAETPAGGDTKINPAALSLSDVQLGDLLLHEFSHTGQDTNFMGSRDYEEGQAYGVEYFYAEVAGDTARMTAIEGIITSASVAVAAQKPALQEQFKVTYALMTAFREVVSKGSSPRLPFPDLTSAGAQLLEKEVVTSFQHPSERLKVYIDYVKAHLSSFKLPPV